MDPAHRRDGAGCAKEMEIRALPGLGGDQREIEKKLRHLLDHALEALAGHVDATMALGQGHDADGQRIPCPDALARIGEGMRRLAVEPGDLGGAAADVEHDDRFRLRVHKRGATRHGQEGFGPAVHHLQLEIEIVSHALR